MVWQDEMFDGMSRLLAPGMTPKEWDCRAACGGVPHEGTYLFQNASGNRV
jgi:hypothetical protein